MPPVGNNRSVSDYGHHPFARSLSMKRKFGYNWSTRVQGTNMEKPTHIKRPIFILGSHKSGTSLLRSLLDSHPSLYCFPKETHFFQYSKYWVDYALRRNEPETSENVDYTQAYLEYIQDHAPNDDVYSDSHGVDVWNKELFLEYFTTFTTDSEKELFELYLNALYYSSRKAPLPPGQRIVEKSVENAEFAYILAQMFSDARFVHIIRNPYANFVSIRKAKTDGTHYPFVMRWASSLYNSYHHMFNNERGIKQYLIIKYEDLITDAATIMKKVAEFLDIEYNNNLTTPTIMGKSWAGNSTSDVGFKGISNIPLTKWKNEIHDYEIHLVNRFALPIIKRFGYEKMVPGKSKWVPVKGEPPKIYLKNRAILSSWD